jgi:hypothetical protein
MRSGFTLWRSLFALEPCPHNLFLLSTVLLIAAPGQPLMTLSPVLRKSTDFKSQRRSLTELDHARCNAIY